MEPIVYAQGSAQVSVPAGQKIAVYSQTPAVVLQQRGSPNFPPMWQVMQTTEAGVEYISSAFATATILRIEAGSMPAYYEVGASPSINAQNLNFQSITVEAADPEETGNVITFPNSDTRGPCVVRSSPNDTVIDPESANPYVYLGYNIGHLWTRVKDDEGAIFWGVEGHWVVNESLTVQEAYLQYLFADADWNDPEPQDIYRRSFMTQFNAETHAALWTCVAGGSEGLDLNINMGTGTIGTDTVVGTPRIRVRDQFVSIDVPTTIVDGLSLGSQSGGLSAGTHFVYSEEFVNQEGSVGFTSNIKQTTSGSNKTSAYGWRLQATFNPQDVKLATGAAYSIVAASELDMGAVAGVGHDFLVGMDARTGIQTGAATGTVTNAIALNIVSPINNQVASADTFRFSRSDGVRIGNMGSPAGNAGLNVHSARGLVIEAQSGGAVSSTDLQVGSSGVPVGGVWSIVQASAIRSAFTGKVYFGSVTDATAKVHIGAGTATANTAPLQIAVGASETVERSGLVQFSNTSASGIQAVNGSRFTLTESDTTERYVVQAESSAKVTAAAPYTNDGYVLVTINGTTHKFMTTA